MKPTIIAALFVVISQPAQACHHFTHWAYPTPQRCNATMHTTYHPTKKDDWYVEIILNEEVMDEISHGVGIEKIKKLNENVQ